MTRHTPDFLRARSSNLSLRSVAMEQSMTMRSEAVDNRVHAKDLKPEAFTKPYLEFMTGNPTVFHAVDYFKEKLVKVGYKEVGVHLPCCPPSSSQPLLTASRDSSPAATAGPASSSLAASTSPPATAAPSLPSPSARPTSPATASP